MSKPFSACPTCQVPCDAQGICRNHPACPDARPALASGVSSPGFEAVRPNPFPVPSSGSGAHRLFKKQPPAAPPIPAIDRAEEGPPTVRPGKQPSSDPLDILPEPTAQDEEPLGPAIIHASTEIPTTTEPITTIPADPEWEKAETERVSKPPADDSADEELGYHEVTPVASIVAHQQEPDRPWSSIPTGPGDPHQDRKISGTFSTSEADDEDETSGTGTT